ncbi:winged helix-turn-helix transcriptional regulator [Treponema sp. OMZ 803]|nr:winged helix-turn-helix transcriptional regulator [Treponema sp. OMZ 803]
MKNLMKNGIIEREQLDGISPYVQYRFREQGKSVVSILCSICKSEIRIL